MSQWHYHVAQFNLQQLADPDTLNDFGEGGWELVCLDRLSGTQTSTIKWLAVFKKQLVQSKKP